jgi:hypothetical protein
MWAPITDWSVVLWYKRKLLHIRAYTHDAVSMSVCQWVSKKAAVSSTHQWWQHPNYVSIVKCRNWTHNNKVVCLCLSLSPDFFGGFQWTFVCGMECNVSGRMWLVNINLCVIRRSKKILYGHKKRRAAQKCIQLAYIKYEIFTIYILIYLSVSCIFREKMKPLLITIYCILGALLITCNNNRIYDYIGVHFCQ